MSLLLWQFQSQQAADLEEKKKKSSSQVVHKHCLFSIKQTDTLTDVLLDLLHQGHDYSLCVCCTIYEYKVK